MAASQREEDALRSEIIECLKQITDPCSAANGTNFNFIEMGLLKEVDIDDGDVLIKMRLTSPACFMLEFFLKEIPRLVGALPGVTSVELEADSGFDWDASMMDPARRREYIAGLRRGVAQMREERAAAAGGRQTKV